MRIYAVADIHGKKNRIKKIHSVIKLHNPELLIIAGDISNYLHPSITINQLKDIPIPVFCIRGNTDFKITEELVDNLKHGTLLDSRPTLMNNYQFIGINGTIPLPFLSKLKWNEANYFKQLQDTINDRTIIVAHAPPRGFRDKVGNRFSAGSRQFKYFIEKTSPLLVLCGHIHEQAGIDNLKKTIILNCAMNKIYSGAIIECDEDNPLDVKMIKQE